MRSEQREQKMARRPEEFERRLNELIRRANAYMQQVQSSGLGRVGSPAKSAQVPKSDLWRFLVSAIQTVNKSCGSDSPHLRELERCREEFVGSNGLDLDTCSGVLEAAHDDLRAGMLQDIKQIAAAEAFGDLLEAAAHLLEQMHHLAAVPICGAVLESSLRDFAKRRALEWEGSSSITKLNQLLYKGGAYDKVVFGEIEAWGKLRNQVAHGDFANPEDVDPGAARRMLEGVRDFVLRSR